MSAVPQPEQKRRDATRETADPISGVERGADKAPETRDEVAARASNAFVVKSAVKLRRSSSWFSGDDAPHLNESPCNFGGRGKIGAASFGRHQSARFEALRRRLFEETRKQDRFWFLTVLPFNLMILVILATRGLSASRLGFQIASVLTWAAIFTWQMRPGAKNRYSTFFLGMTGFFLAIGSTGGLASPILVTSIPMLVAVAFLPVPRQLRAALFLYFAFGCTIMGLLSRTAIGHLTAPLTPVEGYATAEYLLVCGSSLALTLKMIFVTGHKVTILNERLAYEIATRREQICSESTEQTRALEGMAARLAHEVKNPLAAIKGLSIQMARNSSDPKTAERLAIVAAEAERLQSIVDGFLSFSRGLDDLELEMTRPVELARELAVLLETRAAELQITLEATGDDKLSVNVDGRKLRQALINLVSNALQASPPGGQVTMHVEKAGPRARILVVDRGEGMDEATLERIKRPHYTTREGGSGLGIAIARGLVEQHGGELRYESKVGRGTTVTLELPMCALEKAKADRLPQPRAEGGRDPKRTAPSSASVSGQASASASVPVTARVQT